MEIEFTLNGKMTYEEIADEYAMFKYGNAVADAVLQYFAA